MVLLFTFKELSIVQKLSIEVVIWIMVDMALLKLEMIVH